jgi:hypothetical protein
VVGGGDQADGAGEAELFAAGGEVDDEFGEGVGAEVGVLFAAGVAHDGEGALVVDAAEDDAAGVGTVGGVDGGEGGDAG